MVDTAILVEGLGKQYRIGAAPAQSRSMKDAALDLVRAPLRRVRSLRRTEDTPNIWALRDVSFEIKAGEVIGLIGRNGAGKSTLLKILSRITPPTTGRVTLSGRVGSLLEVGTGFHPELTGRENIFLNGAMLGMRRYEITRKFDEIVDFSGVEKFIDTPVKRYSSGMYVRLAFAVAAHLEPEILIVDEVLAVGDAAFQKKCLGKMSEVTQNGRTVIFVSHSMAAITSLCRRVIIMEKGGVFLDTDIQTGVRVYLQKLFEGDQAGFLAPGEKRFGNGAVLFTDFWMEDTDGNTLPVARSGEDVVLAFAYQTADGAPLRGKLSAGFSLVDDHDRTLFIVYNDYTNQLFEDVSGRGVLRCRINRFPLIPANYRVTGVLNVDGEEADRPEKGLGMMLVTEGDFYGTGRTGSNAAPFMVMGDWSVSAAENAASTLHNALKETTP
ncbi:MAG: ABC transporter ATP-binding protein [bacterium]|nr:ABC transporter ATP-binding protein [bacterium]